MSSNLPFSRRRFLGAVASVAGAGAAPFALNLAAMGAAAAEGADDYKAIVCLFLSGGNDSFNSVIATDPASWAEYTRVRTTNEAGSIALPPVGAVGGVLPITPQTLQSGRSFALHPALAPLKGLFDNGRAAIVSNVGALLEPTTKVQIRAGKARMPPKLYSHNDQQSYWQTFAPEGATIGWGGRMADLLGASNSNTTFTSISASGNAVFLSGNTIRSYQIGDAGAGPLNNLSGTLFGAGGAANPLRAIVTARSTDPFENDYSAVVNRALDTQALLSGAMLPAGPAGVPNPSTYANPTTKVLSKNSLAAQLQTVARVIGGRSSLGARRQVFFVTLGGFDNHDFQKVNHADLMARLAHGLAYFDTALSNLQGADMRANVTLFTASDFGRTFTSNGDGTDHGWGAHHFVLGGAVKGGNIYGKFPTSGLGHELDIGSGATLPTVSIDQYGATLASWFGLSATQINDVFPNIVNFSTRNLGFMG